MPNLRTFINSLNEADLHIASSYVFDWPGVFPAIGTLSSETLKKPRFGHAVIQNISLQSVDHVDLPLAIDGHSIPILSTPKLPTGLSMNILLDKSIVNGTYGKLLSMIYTGDLLGSTAGFNSRQNFLDTKIADVANLYPLNIKYDKSADFEKQIFELTNKPCLTIHYPRIKRVGELQFDSMSTDISKCQLEIVFAWIEHSESQSPLNTANKPS